MNYVPLITDDNIITVRAIDTAGHAAERSVTVKCSCQDTKYLHITLIYLNGEV